MLARKETGYKQMCIDIYCQCPNILTLREVSMYTLIMRMIRGEQHVCWECLYYSLIFWDFRSWNVQFCGWNHVSRFGEWKYPWVATKKSFFDGLVCSQKSDFCPHKMERIYEQQACENRADDRYRGTWLQLMWCFRIYIHGGKTRILCGCQKSGILHLTPPLNFL